MNALILFAGFLFGAILQYANLNLYNVISGMATLKNLSVAKAIAVATGTGAFISGVVISLLRKEFKLTIIHSNRENIRVIQFQNGSSGHFLADLS